MAVSRTDPSALDAHALGFRLAPRINAAGRMRRPDAGLELLLTDDPERAIEIAAELDAVNAERRAVEERTTWEVERLIGENGPAQRLRACRGGVAPGGHRDRRLPGRRALPPAGDPDRPERRPHGQGSGRSIPGFDLLGALHAAADELEHYGGHRAAAGLTVARDRVPALTAAIERYAEEALEPELLQPVERVDAVVSGTELGLGLADELCALEPCGMGNPGPSLLVPGGRFDGRRPLGDGSHAQLHRHVRGDPRPGRRVPMRRTCPR